VTYPHLHAAARHFLPPVLPLCMAGYFLLVGVLLTLQTYTLVFLMPTNPTFCAGAAWTFCAPWRCWLNKTTSRSANVATASSAANADRRDDFWCYLLSFSLLQVLLSFLFSVLNITNGCPVFADMRFTRFYSDRLSSRPSAVLPAGQACERLPTLAIRTRCRPFPRLRVDWLLPAHQFIPPACLVSCSSVRLQGWRLPRVPTSLYSFSACLLP